MQDLLGEAPVHLKGREPRVGRGRFQDVIQVKLTCEGSQGRKTGEEEPETTAQLRKCQAGRCRVPEQKLPVRVTSYREELHTCYYSPRKPPKKNANVYTYKDLYVILFSLLFEMII